MRKKIALSFRVSATTIAFLFLNNGFAKFVIIKIKLSFFKLWLKQVVGKSIGAVAFWLEHTPLLDTPINK